MSGRSLRVPRTAPTRAASLFSNGSPTTCRLRAEDSTAVCDRDRYQPRGFTRAATDAERTLLQHLGHELPPAALLTLCELAQRCGPVQAMAPTRNPGGNSTMTETGPGADPTADDAANDSLDLPQNLERARELRRENKTLRDRAKAAEDQYAGAAAIVSAMQMAEVRELPVSISMTPTTC